MAQKVIMPQMGESIAEGTITKWLKKVGDTVERDEPLFEISTDKVDAEIPAPAAGTLIEISVGEGQTVAVNTVVALLGEKGEKAGAAAGSPAAPAAAALAPKSPVAPREAAPSAGPTPAAPPRPAPAQAQPTYVPAAPAPAPVATAPRVETLAKPYSQHPVETLRRVRSSPVVRKIADEHGLSLADIPGTGISGRVTKRDILAVVESGPAVAPAPAFAPAAPTPAPAGAPSAGVVIPDLRIPPYADGEPVVLEPMSIMRQKIAEHMVYSQTVSAHVTSFFEVDFEAVDKQRQAEKAAFAEKGVNLTYMAFIVRAVVDGLQRFPYLNAAVMKNQIVFKKEINIGIAVALEDGKGLIVPVIRNADEKNLLGLARAIGDLAERARTKRLTPEDVQRGTFSITNPGVYGGLMGTPIINQPQVAILGVGTIEKRPVVIDDAIAIRRRAYISLSYDHRLVDGAMAERFMAHLKKTIEGGSFQ